ncbi:hypothetical protein BDW62DRAFT_198924 [Aspergillus aurantiobrunneus]
MDEHRNLAFILRLPDELLESIICSIFSVKVCQSSPYIRSYYDRHETRFGMMASLCLVCRRLYALSMPYLYADLIVACGLGSVQPGSVTKLLHRSCRRNPSLWPLCRRLIVHYRDDLHARDLNKPGNPLYYVAIDLTAWLVETRCFVLFGMGDDERGWDLLRQALTSFRSLTELALVHGDSYRIDYLRVLETLDELGWSQIRTLALDGVFTGGSLSERKWRTAPFTMLKIRSFMETPQRLEDLVRRPAVLEHFDLQFTFGSCYGVMGAYHEWSLAILQPILAIHCHTLRAIKIRCINVGGLSGFDLRSFERLEELTLSSAATGHAYRKYSADDHLLANLLAPRLRRFYWDLTLEDQQCCESLADFGLAEQSWLRALACAATRQQCQLQEIGIKYTPDGAYDCDMEYPWDRMDALDRELEPNGIRVSYNPPSISREEYLVIREKAMAWKRVIELGDG